MTEKDLELDELDVEPGVKNVAIDQEPGELELELDEPVVQGIMVGGLITDESPAGNRFVPNEPKKPKVKVPVVPTEKDGKLPAPVKVEALVFRARMKNSQSVRLVQAELIAQGYAEAGKDVQGWLCEGTQAALARFQTEHGLSGGGVAGEATVAALFDGSVSHYWER